MKAEGWYRDPYGVHDERWFSDGTPTRIVCDHGVESEDPPPNRPYIGPLEPVDEGDQPVIHGSADENQSGQARPGERGVRAGWEAFVETGGD